MSEMVNPYIAGNPVTGTEMFFGREDVFAFVQQALAGRHRDNVIVLYGQRRTGKTSVLYQMSRHLDKRYLCIFIDLHGLALEGLGGLVWELANHIQRTLRREYQIELPRLDHADFMADPRSAFENDFLNLVWSAIGDCHILLMLDEAIRLQEQIQAGKLEKEIFEYLRHLMQHHERLNFLFSLGSGLEEMEKEYAFMFSVGLYKKISFLEREAAMALITQPVKDCYQVEPTAVERILQITSGHPYYTQLLCHSLFNRWQQQHKPQMDVVDVNAVLDEVVERGLAVLKHVWEESTPGEKAVLASVATSMGERNRPVGLHEISRAWAQHDVALPESETARAIKSLIARDVIGGRDSYGFTIDLQRLWVQKFERLEWVKEEIATELAGWTVKYGVAAPTRSFWANKTALAGTAIVLGLFLILIILVLYLANLAQNAMTEARIATTRSAGDLQTAVAGATANAATATVSAHEVQAAAVTRAAATQAPIQTVAAAATQYVKAIATATRYAEAVATASQQGKFIVNSLSGKCIDVVNNGSLLQLWDCEFSQPSTTDQRWEITSDGFIRNTLSGKCIDVKGTPGLANESLLQLWDCEFSNPSTDQRWEITSDGFIRNLLSGKCIDVKGMPGVANESPLQLWDCEFSQPSTTDQRWVFYLPSK